MRSMFWSAVAQQRATQYSAAFFGKPHRYVLALWRLPIGILLVATIAGICFTSCSYHVSITNAALTACFVDAAQFRALLVGAILGTVFSIIIHKLSLTTGIIPSLNIAAGLIGFVAIKGWVSLLKFFRFDPHDFTPQVFFQPISISRERDLQTSRHGDCQTLRGRAALQPISIPTQHILLCCKHGLCLPLLLVHHYGRGL